MGRCWPCASCALECSRSHRNAAPDKRPACTAAAAAVRAARPRRGLLPAAQGARLLRAWVPPPGLHRWRNGAEPVVPKWDNLVLHASMALKTQQGANQLGRPSAPAALPLQTDKRNLFRSEMYRAGVNPDTLLPHGWDPAYDDGGWQNSDAGQKLAVGWWGRADALDRAAAGVAPVPWAWGKAAPVGTEPLPGPDSRGAPAPNPCPPGRPVPRGAAQDGQAHEQAARHDQPTACRCLQ